MRGGGGRGRRPAGPGREKSVTHQGAAAPAARSWRPARGRATRRGVDAREGAAARQSPEPRTPPPPPADGKGATGRERAGGGAGGAGATQGEGAAAAGRGPGARGHRRGGRASKRPPPPSSRAEPLEGNPTSPSLSEPPNLCSPHLPSQQLHKALQEPSPGTPPIPEDPVPASLSPAWPSPLGQEGAAGSREEAGGRLGRALRASETGRGWGHWPRRSVRRALNRTQADVSELSVNPQTPPGLPSTHRPHPAGLGGALP